MPKDNIFKCPFCGFPVGVPLNRDKTTCFHCGKLVTVPKELRTAWSYLNSKLVLLVTFLVGFGVLGFISAFWFGLLPGTALPTVTPRPPIAAPQFNITQYLLDGNLDAASALTQKHPNDSATSYYRIANGIYQGIVSGRGGAPDGLHRAYLELNGDTSAFPDFLPGAWGTDFSMLIKSGHATFNHSYDKDYDVRDPNYKGNFDDGFVNAFSAFEIGRNVPTDLWAYRDDAPFHPAFMLNIERVLVTSAQGTAPQNVFALYSMWTQSKDQAVAHAVHGLSQDNSAIVSLGTSQIPLADDQWVNVRIIETPAPNGHARVFIWINGQLDQDLSRGVDTVERVGVAAGTHYGIFAGQDYRGPLELDYKDIKLYQISGDW